MSDTGLDNCRIGREVAKLRKQHNISSAELARRVGLSQPQISRLENGRQGFRSETLGRISKALGVTPAFFFLTDEEAAQQDRSKASSKRRQIGQGFDADLTEAYGDIAVTPGFRRLVHRMAACLEKETTDPRLLRRLIERILVLSDEDRKSVLASLPRRRSSRKAKTPR